MPRRLTNDLLLATVLALVLSGLLGWALPQAPVAPLFSLHRALGVSLLVLLGWKSAIVLPSLRRRFRRDRSIVVGSAAVLALLFGVAIGLSWTLNLISFDLLWGYSPLNIHVFLGIGLLPFVAWHAWIRRRQNRFSPPVLSRRSALRVAGLGGVAAVGWFAMEPLASALNTRRLLSGSKRTTSLSGNAFPAEIWLFDSVPLLDAESWRLSLAGTQLALGDLQQLPMRSVQAVLDCTSGWWTEQLWSGTSVRELFDARGLTNVQTVTVTSVTGHRIELPADALNDALLATHVGGEVLSAGHGYPVRLVVPGRRGYQWVKWVAEIAVA